MSKDYKPPARKGGRHKSGTGSLLIGILIGLLLGLGLALGVAWYINKMPTPFLNRAAPVKAGPEKNGPPLPAKAEEKTGKTEAKPRFDFYKILPGSEEAVSDQPLKETPRKESTARDGETFFLQAGAFHSAPDADNLKARLALLGMEASVQTTSLPDKGVWHRVRVGPYRGVEELNRARDTLKQNGIESSLIRVRDTPGTK